MRLNLSPEPFGGGSSTHFLFLFSHRSFLSSVCANLIKKLRYKFLFAKALLRCFETALSEPFGRAKRIGTARYKMRLNFTERRRRSVARAEKAKGTNGGFKRFCVPQNGDFDIRAWPSRRAICGMKFDDVQARLIDPVAMNWDFGWANRGRTYIHKSRVCCPAIRR